jgi:LacI family transcriptional regulator
VEKSIAKLGYSPSFAAQSLRTQKSTVIGLIITDIKNPFYPELVSGVEEEARNRGFSLILCNSQEDVEREISYLDYLDSHRTDGVLICAPGMASRQRERLRKFRGTVVLLNENAGDSEFATVSTNNYQGGKQIGAYLKEIGHQKIFYIGTKRESDDGYPRLQGVRTGSGIDAKFIDSERFDGDASSLADEILRLAKPPFAVVGHNDVIAISIMHEFMNRSFSIPDEISIIGYDDIEFSKMVNPSLTTVNQRQRQFGKFGMDLFEGVRQDKGSIKSREVTPELIVRDSSGEITKSKRGKR